MSFDCTDPAATLADVLGCVADCFSLETTFRDCKEIVGAFHIGPGTLTMIEAWAWSRSAEGLVGHWSASPWDDGPWRPSHADKRRAWRHELFGDEIRAALHSGVTERAIIAATERLLNLIA